MSQATVATDDRPTSPGGSARGGGAIAVVGAGPGGLAVAVLLAARGMRVTIYERMDRVGGRTSHVSLPAPGGGEYRFDRGPTFFLMPYVLEEIFAAAGSRMSDHVRLHRLDPMYRLLIGHHADASRPPYRIDTTQDTRAMAERLEAVWPGEGAGFERFIRHNRQKLGLAEGILRRPMRSPLDLFRPELAGDTLRVLPLLQPHRTVHDLLGDYFTDEHAKLAVSFQSKYLGMSPFDCPSLFTILPFIEYEYGVWHPEGGCHALMAALARVARAAGVDIRLSSTVESISFDGRRADGVIVDGERIAHDAVVVNADATWALKRLVPAALRTSGAGAGYADERLDRKRYSCSTCMYYLGIDGEVDLPHHTIYTSAAYRENLHDITGTGGLTLDDPSVYVCNPSRIDATMAPAGKSALYVLVPVANRQTGAANAWDNGAAADLRAATMRQLERVFGIDRLPDRIEAEHVITPADWEAMGINHGATFNLAHNLGQMLHLRPQNRLRGFDGLYLVGGGTHPGSGLPTIFLSSQITAGLVGEAIDARE